MFKKLNFYLVDKQYSVRVVDLLKTKSKIYADGKVISQDSRFFTRKIYLFEHNVFHLGSLETIYVIAINRFLSFGVIVLYKNQVLHGSYEDIQKGLSISSNRILKYQRYREYPAIIRYLSYGFIPGIIYVGLWLFDNEVALSTFSLLIRSTLAVLISGIISWKTSVDNYEDEVSINELLRTTTNRF